MRREEIGIKDMGMKGKIRERSGGEVEDKIVKKVLRDELGVMLVGKFMIGKKCIGVEKLKKIGRIGRKEMSMRIMDMSVDEERKKEVREVIGEFKIRERLKDEIGIVEKEKDKEVLEKKRKVLDIEIGMDVIEDLRIVKKSKKKEEDEKICN